ncbi:MAG: DUF2889 domain-containing protein [Alphaproteobacteria bacterium]|jgi:hypothetical protein
MPLADAAERTLIHERQITCQGYLRADGLWDIEGSLTDAKTYAFESRWRGTVEAGEPVHGMHIRLTIGEDFVIHAVAAASDHAPYEVCSSVAPSLQSLVGASMGRGWTRTLRRRVGGEDGCTHLTELLGRMATAAYQTIFPYRGSRAPGGVDMAKVADRLIGSCRAWRADGDLARELLPERFSGED